MKKRFLSILMALCMMLTLAVPSVAAGDTVDPPIDETSVTQETGGRNRGAGTPRNPRNTGNPRRLHAASVSRRRWRTRRGRGDRGLL